MVSGPDPSTFAPILDNNEKVLWSGRPHPLPFFASGVPLLIFGLLWGAFDYFGFIRHMKAGPETGALVPFFALHLFPLWLALGNLVRLPIVYRNTVYALTNRRVIIRAGFWGIGFESIDYDRIEEASVTVNLIERPAGLGTVRIFSGRTNSKGANLYDNFVGIEKPYEVYRQLKQVSLDIKTDWNYPNALRPAANPGYSTDYKPQ
jgi:uncharacterized membrane protein YdbT with pleckstrin-like domain